MYRSKTTGQYPLTKQQVINQNTNISIPAEWNDEVLEILGIDYVKPVSKPEITSSQRLVEGQPEKRDDDLYYQTWVIQDFSSEEINDLIESTKDIVRESINKKRDTLLNSGFKFTYNSKALTLQTRDNDDKINWLGVLNSASVMIGAGKGTDTTKIRTLENEIIILTYSDVQMLMLQTLNYQSSIYESSWKHKDALELLTDLEDIKSYIFEDNWLS